MKSLRLAASPPHNHFGVTAWDLNKNECAQLRKRLRPLRKRDKKIPDLSLIQTGGLL